MRNLLIAGGVCLLLASTAKAEMQTDRLVAQCAGTDTTMKGLCASYLAGMMDLHALLVGTGRALPMFCLPQEGLSNDHARLTFVEWTRNNPADAQGSARMSVLLALNSAFPCS